MSDSDPFLLQRRGVLLAAGASGAMLAAASLLRMAAPSAAACESVIVLDRRRQESIDFATSLAQSKALIFETSEDLVLQWRTAGLHASPLPVSGLTGWADALVISGLAAEARMRWRVVDGFRPRAGRASFEWRAWPRSA